MKRKASAVLFKIILVLVIIALIAGVVLSAVSGFFLPRKYLEPWEKDYYMQYTDKRLKVAAHGMLAPNAHNMQLWKLRIDSGSTDTFYLYANAQDSLKADANYNDLMICQGTFIEFCAVAAKHLGYDMSVELFPQGEIDEENFIESASQMPVAKITLAHNGQEPDEDGAIIYNQMFLPHTARSPYIIDKPLTSVQRQLLQSSADTDAPEEVSIGIYTDMASVKKIRELSTLGKTAEQTSERLAEENGKIFRANEYKKNNLRYGISLEAMGFSGIKLQLAQGLLTIMPFLNKGDKAAERQIEGARKALETTPAFLVLKSTAPQSRSSQVEVGRAYVRAMLAAKANGIAMHPLSQLVAAYPEGTAVAEEFVDSFTSDGAVPLMAARVGVAQKPPVLSMRKDLNSIIIA